MLRLSRLFKGIAILTTALALTACAGSTVGRSKPGPKVNATQTVKVAVLAPVTASNAGAASLGRALVNAAKLAERDLRRSTKIELMVFDTGGNAGRASAAASKAIAQGAKIILGPLFSANTKAVGAVAAARDVKVIAFSTDSAVAGDPVYLSGFLPEMEARRVIGYARSRGIRATGIFYPQSPLGEVALRGARHAAGSNLVATTSFDRTAEGIVNGARTFADQVRSSGAVGLLVADSGRGLIFAVDQLGENGLTGEQYRYLGLGGWNSRATLSSIKLRNAWFPAPDPSAMQRFVSRYSSRYGTVPPPLAVLGYDAVLIVGQLLQDAAASGSNQPFSTAALTRGQGFRGAVGAIRFTRSGLGQRGMAILEVGDSEFDVVDPAPRSFGRGS